MKYSFLILVLSTLITANASVYADTQCTGAVRVVMDQPSKCEGHLAIMFEGLATNGKWVCTLSNKSESMAIAAVASGQKMTVVFDDSVVSNCATMDTHYLTPKYIYYRNDV